MTRRDVIIARLTEKLRPLSLEVEDESRRHEGHAGARPGGETHFRVVVVAEAFVGRTRLERHRMVNEALADQLSGGLHALAVHARAPGEA